MNDLTPGLIAAYAGGMAIVIAAVAAAIVSVITSWRTLTASVAKIEGHVNSEKTAAEGRENTLTREKELLLEIIAAQKLSASLLAQAAATRGRADTTPAEAAPDVDRGR